MAKDPKDVAPEHEALAETIGLDDDERKKYDQINQEVDDKKKEGKY